MGNGCGTQCTGMVTGRPCVEPVASDIEAIVPAPEDEKVCDTSNPGPVVGEVDSIKEEYHDSSEGMPPSAQILGVAVLEFGIVFHSVRRALSHG